MKLFADECIPPKVFREFGKSIQNTDHNFAFLHLLDLMKQGTPDDEWVPKIAKEGYIVVTGDHGQRSGPRLERILPAYEITSIFFAGRLQQRPVEIKLAALQYIYQHRQRIMHEAAGTRFKLYHDPRSNVHSLRVWM